MGSEEQDRPTSPQPHSDKSEHPHSLVASQGDGILADNQTELLHFTQSVTQADEPAGHGTGVRKSACSMNLVQRFTYVTLGQPSYQPQGRVS